MGSDERAGNRALKANFTPEGLALLSGRVNEKLREFMGDNADDMLVDYVIVLLKNGRDKEHAKNDLDLILGDHCDSFVCWLYDHLDLNIDLYVQPKELQDEASKRKLIADVQAGGNGFQHLNSQSERVKSSKRSRSRRNKDWKGLMGSEAEASALQSFVVKSTYLLKKNKSKASRGLKIPSPPPSVRRKRSRADENQKTKLTKHLWKRDLVSKVNIDAPLRLLQFAVRDAVASNSGTAVEPSLKRLCSVVSASSGDFVDRPWRMQTVAESAEDVIHVGSFASVFDRLSCPINLPDGNDELDDLYQHQEQSQFLHLQRDNYAIPYTSNSTMLGHETGFHSEETSDNEGFDEVNVMDRVVTGASQLGSSGVKIGDDSLMVNYCVPIIADGGMHLKWNRDQDQPPAAHSTSKIVNISVNVNTWNPPGPPQPREVAALDAHKTLVGETGAHGFGLQTMKENAKVVKVSNGNVNPAFGLRTGLQKEQLSTSGFGAAVCPLEDADSRTIFASNVHFAATKNALSRHFNKFGEVLKVMIVTDVMTGQPKGAAYVEFMQKEAADNALTLDGTSFMSRIMKVVRKSAAHQESAPTVPWPPIVRSSTFPSARFSKDPFTRANNSGALRTPPSVKFGAMSFQWKRDSQVALSVTGPSLSNSSIPPPTSRGLTYIRTESKLECSSTTI